MVTQIDKNSLIVRVFGENNLLLRSASSGDLENLRLWKNAQRQYFFHKNEISQEQQLSWFSSFQSRADDYMFIAESDGQSFGCMGIRLLDKVWDVYNIILGIPEFGGHGFMSRAFNQMIDFGRANRDLPVTLQVLKANPAVSWYAKNGFVVSAENDDHFSMIFDFANFEKETL
jgi:RimJ/RimL family protein N-acetyltransferase